MTYSEEQWSRRGISRMDYGSQVTHLTRSTCVGEKSFSALDVLIKILRERRIIGSTTSSGFIIGSRTAVCFQDAPPYSICENIDYEISVQNKIGSGKVRYEACGLMFQKPYVFRKGGRPVIYEQKDVAKAMLHKDEWWRIVNYDLSTNGSYIDWTHEREWRIPGDFEFDIKEVTVVVMNAVEFNEFYSKSAQGGEDVAKLVSCVLPLGAIFI